MNHLSINSLTLEPQTYIFAENRELRTDSVKVAHAFGKEHHNVIKAIDKILSQVSDSFGKVNFNVSEYEVKNNLGFTLSHRSYSMTKDGFMMLVMGFTGSKAMQIKEAYINAFNAMESNLLAASLPEKPTKLCLSGGLTLAQQDALKALVKERAGMLPEEARGKACMKMWGALSRKFGCSYKQISAADFDNAISLVSRLEL